MQVLRRMHFKSSLNPCILACGSCLESRCWYIETDVGLNNISLVKKTIEAGEETQMKSEVDLNLLEETITRLVLYEMTSLDLHLTQQTRDVNLHLL